MLLKKYVSSTWLLGTIIVLLLSCNEPSAIGLELVEDDQIELLSIDNIPFEMRTVTLDSLLVYGTPPDVPASLLTLPVLFCGDMNDPIFGKSKASIYAQLTLNFLSPNYRLAPYEVKSVELILPYSSDMAFYGDTTETMDVEVFQLSERLSNFENYYSNQDFNFRPTSIGRASILPTPTTPKTLIRNNGDGTFDTLSFSYEKITIAQSVGSVLLGIDSLTYTSDSSFIDVFNGVHIRAANETRSMLGFNLANSNAGLLVSYDTIGTGGEPLQYLYPFVAPSNGFFVPYRTVRLSRFEHNYENVLVGDAISNAPTRNDLAFTQGLSGVNTVITFTDLTALKDIIVNKATLELRVAFLDGSRNDIFPPAEQVLLYEVKGDGSLELIEDFSLAGLSISDIADATGGNIVFNALDPQLVRYNLNLSSHFQRIITGEATNQIAVQISGTPTSNFLVIQGSTKAAQASRTILGTPENTRFKPTFKLIYTKF